MSAAAVLAGPLIVAMIVGGGVLFLVARTLRILIRDKTAREHLDLVIGAEKRVRALAKLQAQVIDGIISDETARGAAYMDMPGDLRQALYAAHSQATEMERVIYQ